VSGDDALDDLVRTLHDERGFASATLRNHQRSLRPFLAWLTERNRPWAETTLDDVSAYLASRPRWSRATIAFHVQSLRTLFRHGATRGWCRPGFAKTIEAPRLYTHERLPQSPQWSEVQRLLQANRDDTATQIRNYAMLVLLAVYGFRSGEVRGLTLDDIDWEHERIRPPRPKQRKVGDRTCGHHAIASDGRNRTRGQARSPSGTPGQSVVVMAATLFATILLSRRPEEAHETRDVKDR
jgi:integrase/recombinase XerD